jgi:hypothetical protein
VRRAAGTLLERDMNKDMRSGLGPAFVHAGLPLYGYETKDGAQERYFLR